MCSSGLEGPFAVPSSAMALGLVVTCTSGVAGEAVCWVGRGPLGFDRSSGSSLLGWRTGGAGNSTRDGEFFPPSTRGVSPFLATDSSRGCLLRPSAPRWDIRRSWRLRGVMGSWRGNPHSARGGPSGGGAVRACRSISCSSSSGRWRRGIFVADASSCPSGGGVVRARRSISCSSCPSGGGVVRARRSISCSSSSERWRRGVFAVDASSSSLRFIRGGFGDHAFRKPGSFTSDWRPYSSREIHYLASSLLCRLEWSG